MCRRTGSRAWSDEPLNTFDHPGILVATMMQAIRLIHEVDDENVRILCDVYHVQRVEGNLTQTILENLSLIKHVQIADGPGRHEPGTGEVNYRFVLEELANATSVDGSLWSISHSEARWLLVNGCENIGKKGRVSRVAPAASRDTRSA